MPGFDRDNFVKLLTAELLATQQAAASHHQHAIHLVGRWIEAEQYGYQRLRQHGLLRGQASPSTIRLESCPMPLKLLSRTTENQNDAYHDGVRCPLDPAPSRLIETLANDSFEEPKITYGFHVAPTADRIPVTKFDQSVHESPGFSSTQAVLGDARSKLTYASFSAPGGREVPASMLLTQTPFSAPSETGSSVPQKGNAHLKSSCANWEKNSKSLEATVTFTSEVAKPCNAINKDSTSQAMQSHTESGKSARLTKTSLLSVARREHEETEPADGIPHRETIKSKIRQALEKPTYDVRDLYKRSGIWQRIARATWFDNLTLSVIAFNALWIAIDTDFNDAPVILSAELHFQVVEQILCIYFSFEWFTRYLSFARTVDSVQDAWFLFDSMLVGSMVFESWLLSAFMYITSSSSQSSGMGNASVLRIGRLLRLSRMARIGRLLRMIPELVILCKGMVASARSVLTTLFLLLVITYVSGIAFKQITSGTQVGDERFSDVLSSMYTLLLYGVLCLDYTETIVAGLVKVHLMAAGLYFLYILLACFTVMNMLIGVLCEVVSNVAAFEKEAMVLSCTRSKLFEIFKDLDENGNMLISHAEFVKLLDNPRACVALHEMGVDVEGLVEIADVMFEQSDDGTKVELTFPELMQILLQLRGSTSVTVKDIVELRKLIRSMTKDIITELSKGAYVRNGHAKSVASPRRPNSQYDKA